jgi:hypothetical protein
MQTIRRAVPAVLTVLASVAILSGAVWIHNQQSHPTVAATLGGGNSNFPSTSQDTSTDGNTPVPHPAKNTGNETEPASQGADSSSSNHTSPSSPSSTGPSQPQSGDIGFGPVSGGTVKALPDSPLSGGSQASCLVTQYGSSLQTSFGDRGLATPAGNDLPLPSGISSHSLLALSLKSGVLWAPVPETSMDSAGRPFTSNAPTTLYYTPYPSSGDTSATLATGAVSLGQLPVAVTGDTSPHDVSWYQPVTAHFATQSTQNNTVSSNSTSGAATGSTPDGAYHLFLQGFYQTSVGAVIAVSVNDTASNSLNTWLYLWNEQDKTLKPITQLQNGHDSFSWFAVGQDVVYWESRHVLPPKYANFQGEQSVMNCHTLGVTRIHLGTWSSQAVAFGNALQFEAGHSSQWEEFNPDSTIAPAD